MANFNYCSLFWMFPNTISLKVIKSVYIAKSRQRYRKALTNILLPVPNHALKNMYMLNYETKKNTDSFYYRSIKVLIDFINSVIAMHVFYKQLQFLLQANDFCHLVSLSSVYLFSIQQLREVIADM